MANGIQTRHQRSCRSRRGAGARGGRCDCEPTYQVRVWDGENGERITRTFSDLTEARGWRRDALIALRKGRQPQTRNTTTLEDAASTWLERMAASVVRARGGAQYKPSTIRSYERNLRLHVYPVLGREPLADIRRADLQELVDAMGADGAEAATVHGPVIALKALFRFEISRGRISANANPTPGLELPAVDGRRDRIADPVEAARLLEVLSDDDRPIWATAFYCGLRRGELRALRVSKVDLQKRVIDVERGWDDLEGEIATKGRNRRRVPIPNVLLPLLREHLLRSGRRGEDLIFGASERTPFAARDLTRRADDAWAAAGLRRIVLHEARHTFASLMIAAGVNAKALSTYMGHASISTTFDLYGHLMPGNEDQAAELLDAYLERAANARSGP
jgi:integrase